MNRTISFFGNFLFARRNLGDSKGITRKEFWYRTDVSINWGICISPSKIMQGNIT
jgi:hypothetical protein